VGSLLWLWLELDLTLHVYARLTLMGPGAVELDLHSTVHVTMLSDGQVLAATLPHGRADVNTCIVLGMLAYDVGLP